MSQAALMRRPLRNLGWLLGSRGVNAVLSLLYLTLATRSLGLADFGRFTLIVVMAQAITGIVSFSTWQAVVKWGAIEGEGDRATGFAVALDLVSVVCGSLVAAGAVWAAPQWLPLPPELRLQAFGLCLASLLAIRSTPTGLLRLHDRYDLAAAAEAAQPATRAGGAVLAALFFPHIGGFIAAWAAAEFACALAHWRLALRVATVRLSEVSLRALPAAHPGVWRFVWATNLSRSLAVSSKQVLLLLIGAVGGAALAGGFRVASQIGTAMVQLGEAVSRALYPELVRAEADSAAIARKVAMLSAAGGFLAVAMAALIGRWGLTLIAGPEFAFAAVAMAILVAAGALELVAASWDTLLVAKGRAELPFLLRLVPLVLALALLAPAIAWDGLRGAALCMLLSSALTALGLGYVALRGDRR